MMLGFSAIIAIMIISSTYILYGLNSVASSTKKILAANVQTQEISRALLDLIQDENSYIEKLQISEDPTYSNLFFETSKQVLRNMNALMDKQASKQDQDLIRTMRSAHADLVTCMIEPPDDKANIEHLRLKNMEVISSCLDTLIKKNQSYIGLKMAEIEVITARSVKIALALIIGTLLVSVTAALLITRTITTPIENLIRGTEQIASGNFEDIHITSRDEIALLANAMNDMSTKIDNTNKLRTQMMQQISHEIKTPLQTMQSVHDILKASNAVKEEKLHMLATLKRSINKISGFSRQYMDLAKIESGIMQYDMQWTQLDEVVNPIVDEAKILAASKNIDLKLEAGNLPEIQIDREKISIVISNLLTNAIKYTHENGKVLIRLAPSDQGVNIQVQDSGIGIDKDEIANVFIRFYQARNIEKIRSNGSGVGLAIVRAYTEGHGGNVSVESQPDEGSTFKIDLPISKNPENKHPEHEARQTIGKKPPLMS